MSAYRDRLREFRRAVLYQALAECGFNQSLAARELGVHRNRFYQMMKEAKLDAGQAKENFRSAQVLADGASPVRQRLPETRESVTKKFRVGDHKGYVIVGLYADGRPGELFIKLDAAGSTARGFADQWALLFSLGLQHGVPMELMIAKAERTRFEPMGLTGDPDIPSVSSVLDYVARWLRKRFLEEKK